MSAVDRSYCKNPLSKAFNGTPAQYGGPFFITRLMHENVHFISTLITFCTSLAMENDCQVGSSGFQMLGQCLYSLNRYQA